MCVIPFDAANPFPGRTGRSDGGGSTAADRIACLERQLAVAVEETVRQRERAHRAEAQANELMTQLLREQLISDSVTPVPIAG